VSSGVEAAFGEKSPERIGQFVAEVARATEA
jgi:phosphoribosylanthranilate isomerase